MNKLPTRDNFNEMPWVCRLYR